MKLEDIKSAHLTYCLNVHPGETWQENFTAIQTCTLDIRNRVAPGQPFGLGLRLSAQAAVTLMQPDQMQVFKNFLAAHDLYVFTVNGFPYGSFHGERIKENVYAPDWRSSERLKYTNTLADILAELAPTNIEASISTVPCSYKAWIHTDADRRAIVENLMQCVAHLVQLRQSQDKTITLALEPEPDCLIENTAEMVEFFESDLAVDGSRMLAGTLKCSATEAQEHIRRHLGICFDTCHLALQFEPIEESLKTLVQHDIRICKIQISAALKVDMGRASRASFDAILQSPYLHQVRARAGDGTTISFPDLPNALQAADPRSGEWRVHCHVPLYFQGSGLLGTTADELTPGFFQLALNAGVDQFEIETYTFNILPDSLRKRNIVESITEEYRWVRERFKVKG